VLEAARDAAVPVVYASSAAVYGDQARLPISSANSTPTPRGLLARSRFQQCA